MAEDLYWRVTPEQAKCLLDNAEAYTSQGTEIIIIPIETCPFPSLSVESLDGLSNYGGVSKIATEESSDGLDTIISYTLNELTCLSSDQVRIDADVAYLPKFLDCPKR